MRMRTTLALRLRPALDRLQLRGSRALIEAALRDASGEIDVRLSTGVRLRVDLADRVERLMAFRAYERVDLTRVRALLKPGDVVFDVGAHVGYYTLHAARLVGGTGAVHAFEPVPRNAARLRANVALNAFTNVEVVEAAVSAVGGRARFGTVPLPGESGWGSMLVAGDEGSADIDVPAVSLDEYAAARAIDRVALIKIDVQGSEMDVLRGARTVLTTAGPDVLCELDPYWLARAGTTAADIIEMMEGFGYTAVRDGGRPNVFFTKRP